MKLTQARGCLLVLLLAATAAAGFQSDVPRPLRSGQVGPRWKLMYFYDRDQSSLIINDLAFSSPQRGIACGFITRKKARPSGVVLVTRDGGTSWTEVPVKDIPISLFLLSDNSGWMITDRGIWKTDEAGRSWKKINGTSNLRRVHFLDEQHGFVTGAPKLFKETRDGGKTWKDIAAADSLQLTAENTYFDWIEWVTPKRAIVLGANVAPRPGLMGSFMDPEKLARRREWPGLNITLETNDGGSTWTPQTVPTFGRFQRIRVSPDVRIGLSLVRFVNAFQYPSEVYKVSGQGGSTRSYREKNRNVTDVAFLGKEGLLVAVEPPGKLYQLPIPGKLHVLRSDDLQKWAEMKVDYRAFGQRAIIATSGPDAWVATDSGQILKLVQ